MKTISADQFKKQFGEQTYNSFPTPQTSKSEQTGGYFKDVTEAVGTDINQRIGNTQEILADKNTGLAKKGLQIFGQGAGLAANALEKTIGNVPGIKQATEAIGSGINWLATSEYSPTKHLGDLIGNTETLKEVVSLYDNDKEFKHTVDAVANIARLGGDVGSIVDSATYVKNVTNKIVDGIKTPKIKVGGRTLTLDEIHTPDGRKFIDSLPPEQQVMATNFDDLHSSKLALDNAIKMKAPKEDITLLRQVYEGHLGEAPVLAGAGVPSTIGKNIMRDVVPSSERFVSTEVTKALDLTQGDVKNISLSTGNDVGEFLADKNLIGENLPTTQSNIKNFYKENYNLVREEIGKVKDIYKVKDVPRYNEGLTEIKAQIQDVSGLEKANAEVDSLLKKKTITLNDIQRVKELMDEHFSLYKAVGDVKEGVTKKGLANMRSDLRKFIEQKVEENGGKSIKELNNNVQTSRSIQDAIETRSTRGLTRANISAGDIMTFLTGSTFGSPIVGALAVVAKKIYQSPTFKLRLSKWLDGLNDAKRAKIKAELEVGKLPPEIKVQAQSLNNSSKVLKPEKTSNTTLEQNSKNDVIQ